MRQMWVLEKLSFKIFRGIMPPIVCRNSGMKSYMVKKKRKFYYLSILTEVGQNVFLPFKKKKHETNCASVGQESILLVNHLFRAMVF